MEKSYYHSPVGKLEIICDNNELISLKITDGINISGTDAKFMKNIKSQLDEYFSGKRKVFDIKINPKGTEFQKAVWKELQKIPYGQTKSYSDIAGNIGKHAAQRAVGNACNKNPVMIVIPCHRVIAKNGNIAGFACGTRIKRQLLKAEKCVEQRA